MFSVCKALFDAGFCTASTALQNTEYASLQGEAEYLEDEIAKLKQKTKFMLSFGDATNFVGGNFYIYKTLISSISGQSFANKMLEVNIDNTTTSIYSPATLDGGATVNNGLTVNGGASLFGSYTEDATNSVKLEGAIALNPSVYQTMKLSQNSSKLNTLDIKLRGRQTLSDYETANSVKFNDVTLQVVPTDVTDLMNRHNSGQLLHYGTGFASLLSSTGRSFIYTLNNFSNMVVSMFKAKESNTSNVYDAYISVTGNPSSSATNLGGSLNSANTYQNTTLNSCGTMTLGASRIDIGNVADEINIGACKTDATGFNYNSNIPANQTSARNYITIGNENSVVRINGRIEYTGDVLTNIDLNSEPIKNADAIPDFIQAYNPFNR